MKPASRRDGEQTMDLLETLKVAADSQKNIIRLPIRDITVDESLQVRVDGLNENTVQNYIAVLENEGDMREIVVFRLPDGELLLSSGFHRIEAHRRLGLLDITAEIRQGTRRDAIEFAFEDNKTHGLPLSNKDKKAYMLARLEDGTWTQLGNRELARRLSVGHATIGRWIEEHDATGSFEPVERAATVGADGRVRNTAKIKQANREREKPADAHSVTDGLYQSPFQGVPREKIDGQSLILNTLEKERANAGQALRIMDAQRVSFFKLLDAFKLKWKREDVRLLLEDAYRIADSTLNELDEVARELGFLGDSG